MVVVSDLDWRADSAATAGPTDLDAYLDLSPHAQGVVVPTVTTHTPNNSVVRR